VVAPAAVATLTGRFVAEVGIGVVHDSEPPPVPVGIPFESPETQLAERIKAEFDPNGRLNPGVSLV
jgi:glycolate oxidase FAD binding subunit